MINSSFLQEGDLKIYSIKMRVHHYLTGKCLEKELQMMFLRRFIVCLYPLHGADNGKSELPVKLVLLFIGTAFQRPPFVFLFCFIICLRLCMRACRGGGTHAKPIAIGYSKNYFKRIKELYIIIYILNGFGHSVKKKLDKISCFGHFSSFELVNMYERWKNEWKGIDNHACAW